MNKILILALCMLCVGCEKKLDVHGNPIPSEYEFVVTIKDNYNDGVSSPMVYSSQYGSGEFADSHSLKVTNMQYKKIKLNDFVKVVDKKIFVLRNNEWVDVDGLPVP